MSAAVAMSQRASPSIDPFDPFVLTIKILFVPKRDDFPTRHMLADKCHPDKCTGVPLASATVLDVGLGPVLAALASHHRSADDYRAGMIVVSCRDRSDWGARRPTWSRAAKKIFRAVGNRTPDLAAPYPNRIIAPMGLLCTFGHKAGRWKWNAGLTLGDCRRCGRPLIRAQDGRWYEIPHGFTVRWAQEGEHALRPQEAMSLARQNAPLAHRVRPQPLGPDHPRVAASFADGNVERPRPKPAKPTF